MNQLKVFLKKIPVQLLLWFKWLLFLICLVILLLTMTELNSRLIVSQSESTQFYTAWYGYRIFLAEGTNPYGQEMQTQILDSESAFAENIESRDIYLRQPLYGIIVYLPFIFIRDFSVAYAWWLTLLELALLLMVVFGVLIIKKNLKQNILYLIIAFFLAFGSLQFFDAIRQGSTVFLSFFLLFIAVRALQKGGDEFTGVILAGLTVFPFFGWISLLFILIWSLRQGRSKVFWWFLGTIVLFGFAVALLEPQWLLYYLRMWVRYFESIEVSFILQTLQSVFPATFLLPGFITIFLSALLFLEWILAGRREFTLFYWSFQLTLVIESLLTLDVDLVNLIFLPTSLAFILAIWVDRWKEKGRAVGLLMAILCTLLPWSLDSILGERGLVQELLLVGLSAVLVLANLYWIRWWITRNVNLWQHDIYSLEESGHDRGIL